MKKAIVIGALLALLAVWCSIRSNAAQPASTGPASTQPLVGLFHVKVVMTQPKQPGKGLMQDVPRPDPAGIIISVRDGQEGQYAAGGQIPFGPKNSKIDVSYGITVNAAVHRTAADKLLVYLYFAHDDLDGDPADHHFRTKQTGCHEVREINPGDTVTLELGDGWGMKATISADR